MKLRLIGLFCFINSSYANVLNFDVCKSLICDVVVDAGYSGTRVHVYAYNPKSFRKNPNIHEIYEKKVNISFTNILPNEVDNILTPLFQDFPKISLSTYFYATESYRSISLMKQIQYSKAARKWFSSHEQFKLKEIRKITGQEEAAYAWISNYFHLSNRKSKNFHFGIIEVGAGSAQIAFLYNPIMLSLYADNANIVSFNWFDDRLITIWTKSLSKFGRENMSKFVVCNAPTEFQSCVNKFKKESLKLNGRGLDEIKSAVAKIKGQTTWYGLGVLSYLGQSKFLNTKTNTYQISDLKNKGSAAFCEASHEAIQHDSAPFVSLACFNYAYIYTLTHQLFGLNDSTTIHYNPTAKGQGWPEGIIIWRLLKG